MQPVTSFILGHVHFLFRVWDNAVWKALHVAAGSRCSSSQLHSKLVFVIHWVCTPAHSTRCSTERRIVPVLQVGYGLKGDLAAIATALGEEGPGCIAVVEPQLEMGALHRLLLAKHVPGIRKVRAGLPVGQRYKTFLSKVHLEN